MYIHVYINFNVTIQGVSYLYLRNISLIYYLGPPWVPWGRTDV